ncbi:MAG TPA: hypothetical protein VM120_01245 [Bryobacteraceae bacterium]|nr:hypothetical protein [Bryobacteraceae bacterium]
MKNYVARDASGKILTGEAEIAHVKSLIEKHVATMMATATAGLPKPTELRESKPAITTTLQEDRAREEETRNDLYRKAINEGHSESYARAFGGGRDNPHWAPPKATAPGDALHASIKRSFLALGLSEAAAETAARGRQ